MWKDWEIRKSRIGLYWLFLSCTLYKELIQTLAVYRHKTSLLLQYHFFNFNKCNSSVLSMLTLCTTRVDLLCWSSFMFSYISWGGHLYICLSGWNNYYCFMEERSRSTRTILRSEFQASQCRTGNISFCELFSCSNTTVVQSLMNQTCYTVREMLTSC